MRQKDLYLLGKVSQVGANALHLQALFLLRAFAAGSFSYSFRAGPCWPF